MVDTLCGRVIIDLKSKTLYVIVIVSLM